MPTTVEQIDLWRQSRSEHERLEFNEAKRQFDSEKLYKYCIALSNEGGGVLLLGISNSPPRTVVGTQAFPDRVAAAEKLFHAVGFRVDIEEVTHTDGRVLIFHVPPRPRGMAYELKGSYYMRSGEALVGMSPDQLKRIFDEVKPRQSIRLLLLVLSGIIILGVIFTISRAFQQHQSPNTPLISDEQRAWVGMDLSHVDQFDTDKLLQAQIQFSNSGKTPARNVRRSQGMMISPFFVAGPPKEEVDKLPIREGGSLAAGAKMTILTGESPLKTDYHVLAKSASDQYSAVRSKHVFVYIFGRILYEDVNDKTHTTEYCLFLIDKSYPAKPPNWKLAACNGFNGME